MGFCGGVRVHERRTAPHRRLIQTWGFIALGLVAWAISRLLVSFDIAGQDNLISHAGYPLLALFSSLSLLCMVPRPTSREDTLKLALDLLIALTSLTTVAWFFFLGPRSLYAEGSGTSTTWATIHVVASIILMLSLLTLVHLRRDEARSDGRRLPIEADPNEPLGRLVLPYAFAAAPLLLSGWQEITGHLARPGSTLFVSSTLTIGLLVARQGLGIVQSRRLMRRLSLQIDRDSLTGLINHRKVHEEIQREIETAGLRGYPVSVALIDVDNFKAVNDSFGHQAGDQVLRALSHLLSSSCRGTDIVGRYAGDEFMLVFPGVDHTDVWTVCNRILHDVRQRQDDWNPQPEANIGLSIGVAATRLCRRPVDQLVAIADAAMYDAKNAGKNRMVVVDADTLVARIEKPTPVAPRHIRRLRPNVVPIHHISEAAETVDSLSS